MPQKLTDMQLVLLATACERADGSLLPPAESLGTQGTRIRRAVAALIKLTLASECDQNEQAKAWREEDGRPVGVVITDAGRARIAEEQDGPSRSAPGGAIDGRADPAGDDRPDSLATVVPDPTPPDPAPIKASPGPRAGTKQALVLDLLHRAHGATLAELVTATGWLPHTTRAALTGLRKKGHRIDKATRDGATAYLIATA